MCVLYLSVNYPFKDETRGYREGCKNMQIHLYVLTSFRIVAARKGGGLNK